MRLLIVEDEKQLCRNIAKYMKMEGYTSDCCFSGGDAMDYIEAADYDAVILDIMLPEVNGMDILKKIRAGGRTTPVLLLTAKNTV
ncbi:response regulator [Aminicella lysinilytica]|uniref:response regulator n=1 Tax=Aminicella lysinilytica TaxID=433323 RepID=UPI002ED3ECA4